MGSSKTCSLSEFTQIVVELEGTPSDSTITNVILEKEQTSYTFIGCNLLELLITCNTIPTDATLTTGTYTLKKVTINDVEFASDPATLTVIYGAAILGVNTDITINSGEQFTVVLASKVTTAEIYSSNTEEAQQLTCADESGEFKCSTDATMGTTAANTVYYKDGCGDIVSVEFNVTITQAVGTQYTISDFSFGDDKQCVTLITKSIKIKLNNAPNNSFSLEITDGKEEPNKYTFTCDILSAEMTCTTTSEIVFGSYSISKVSSSKPDEESFTFSGITTPIKYMASLGTVNPSQTLNSETTQFIVALSDASANTMEIYLDAEGKKKNHM